MPLFKCHVVVAASAVETSLKISVDGLERKPETGWGSDVVAAAVTGQDAAFLCHLVLHCGDVSGRDDRIHTMPCANGLGRAIQRGQPPGAPVYAGCNPYSAPERPTELRAMDTAYYVKKMK